MQAPSIGRSPNLILEFEIPIWLTQLDEFSNWLSLEIAK